MKRWKNGDITTFDHVELVEEIQLTFLQKGNKLLPSYTEQYCGWHLPLITTLSILL
jgi:hypothetical protein